MIVKKKTYNELLSKIEKLKQLATNLELERNKYKREIVAIRTVVNMALQYPPDKYGKVKVTLEVDIKELELL